MTSVKEKIQLKRNIDIDLSGRCPMLCPMCWRQSDPIAKKQGHDMTVDNFLKVIEFVQLGSVKGFIYFSGALSDPIHHPKFIDFLKICADKNIYCEVQTASSFKSKEWFIEAFKAHPKARWQFGIDGLPEDSHKYRINQDGQKLFDIMVEATKHLKTYPIWQYIVFKYNQDHVEYCKEWAKDIGCKFKLVLSGKTTDFFIEDFEKFIPTNKKYRIARNNDNDNLSQFQTYMNVVENEKE